MSDFQFLNESQIKEISKKKEMIIWGCGPTSKHIIQTLNDLGINIAFMGDSDDRLQGKVIEGIYVLALTDMANHSNAAVIIGSFGYIPIINTLGEIGIKNICGLRDVFKYSIKKMESDRLSFDYYFSHYSDNKSCKILVELYGNIGDTIIRVGIVKQLISRYGEENVYLLFADSRNAELYKLLTDNILILEEKDLLNDSLRLEKLRTINELYFAKSFVLCDIRIYAQRRILNSYNCNIGEVIFDNSLPDNEYLVGRDIENICKYLGFFDTSSFLSWNILSKYISKYNDCDLIDGRYVVINLGASRRLRQYNPIEFRTVCRHIINLEYELVILGCGEDDEAITQNLLGDCVISQHSTNLVSKLAIIESAAVMSKASFFVGTDSGLWNISYTLGIPSVVLYGGGEYGNFMHPDGLIKYVTVSDKDCFGCKWYCDKVDDYGRAKCVYDITPDQIIAAIDELIQEIPSNIEY